MRLLTLEFQELKDRNKVAREYDKRRGGYRVYNKNGRYYIELGQDK